MNLFNKIFMFIAIVLPALVLAAALLFRYAVVKTLGGVETREPDTLARVRVLLRLCLSDPKKAKLVLTKDRGNAGLSRRRRPNIAKIKHHQRQQKTLDEMRVRLATKLRNKSQ